MTRRGKIRVFTLTLGLGLVLSGLLLDARAMLVRSQTQLEYGYRRALNDLTDYVSGLEATLEKAPYVNTAVLQGQVSAKLLEQSGGAKAAMAALPLSEDRTYRLSRFLSQTGDYALFLSRSAAAGKPRNRDFQQNLETLGSCARQLSQALKKAQARLRLENVSIGRVESLLNNVETIDRLPVLDDDLDEAAQALSQFPTLLYDGPFSDHIQRREPLLLQGKEEITPQQAAEKAAAFLGCAPEDLVFQGEGGEQLAVYSFTCGDAHVNITKTGGETAYFKKASAPSETVFTCQEAVEEAAGLLERMGIQNVQETYYAVSDRLCVVHFAGTDRLEDGREVLCYPDLITVTVELAEKAMVEYDAAGYCMNHRPRTLEAPALSREEAEKSLSPLLTPDSAGLAVIPSPGLEEVLCWEFACRGETRDGELLEFLVYINAATGLEEQLYLLEKNDHGTFVN